MENNNNVLEIRGLNSYFFTEKGVAPAVDGLDLDIPKGQDHRPGGGRAAAAKV